jgi:hypothetical protein
LDKKYQTFGSFDDVLDIAVLKGESLSRESLGGTKFAIVSNSAVLHLVDSIGNTDSCVGHSDVILAVEVFPGGYGNYFSVCTI